MANPPKKKGTAGETELLGLLEDMLGRKFRRTAPGTLWDLETVNHVPGNVVRVLATRPDRGRWLVSMPVIDWAQGIDDTEIRVEVKRYARFALHKIWEGKFGR